MPHSYGIRARTRGLFSKGFRQNGLPSLRGNLRTYRINDYVDIKVNGAVHKGMPYKIYHGKTGKVFNVNPNAIGVLVNKQVRGRIVQKRVHVRVEHINPSKCVENFKNRVRTAEKEKRDKLKKRGQNNSYTYQRKYRGQQNIGISSGVLNQRKYNSILVSSI